MAGDKNCCGWVPVGLCGISSISREGYSHTSQGAEQTTRTPVPSRVPPGRCVVGLCQIDGMPPKPVPFKIGSWGRHWAVERRGAARNLEK